MTELELEFDAYDKDELEVLTVIQVVKKARIEEARKRVPDDLKTSHPYSVMALWTFYLDTEHQPEGPSCNYCQMFDGQTFTGDMLRTTFPDHEWRGNDIYANVHKTLWGEKADGTCGCLLIREPSEVDTNLSMWSQIGVDWKEQKKESGEEE